MGVPKVFISHSSKDKLITDALVELLKKGGIPENQIVASSTPGTQIHTGASLYTELRNELSNDNVFVFFLLSDNFYESTVCLNEMGATWVKGVPYMPMILPGFSFSKVEGVIKENERVGVSLFNLDENTRERFGHIKTALADRFGIDIPDANWELGLLHLFSEVAKYKELASGSRIFATTEANGVCIGDNQHKGCYVWGRESSDTKTTAIIDFSLTKSDLCSIVFPTEQSDWRPYAEKKKLLCFDIYANVPTVQAQVEAQLAQGRNITTPILITDDIQSYRIPLSQFTTSPTAWQNVSRVCFLFFNEHISGKTTVVIKNLRLE